MNFAVASGFASRSFRVSMATPVHPSATSLLTMHQKWEGPTPMYGKEHMLAAQTVPGVS